MTLTRTAPLAVVEDAFAALNRGDYDAYSAFLSDDVRYEGASLVIGAAAARAVDLAVFGQLSRHWRRIERSIVDRDTVVVWLRFGGMVGATGAEFEIDICDVIEVRDGRITSLRMYADWPAAAAALGAGA